MNEENTKEEKQPRKPGKIINIDEAQVESLLDRKIKESVEETINGLLDAEADMLCGAKRYEHNPERVDTRAGSYKRKLHTKAGEVELKVPKLRNLPFACHSMSPFPEEETADRTA